MDRRSFFAALTAPLLAPLRKLLPKPAAPPGVWHANFAVNTAEIYSPKRIYTFVGDKMVHVHEYGYWHGKLPFVSYDASKLTVSIGKDASA